MKAFPMVGGTPNETCCSRESEGSGDVDAILRIDGDARLTRDTLMIHDHFPPERRRLSGGADDRLPPKRKETRHQQDCKRGD